MRHRSDHSRPLFHFLDVPFQDVMRHPDALRAMYEQRLDGMIVRGVFSPAEVDGAVGARPRRTLGGFLGFSQNHDRVLYWS